jgi:auxin efflux carrier family protein
MTGSVVSSFLGALQASWSVLLVILYGVLAAEFKLLDRSSAKKISTVCVRLFLPALLITKIGRELDLETGVRYVPILVWALLYNVVSLAIGLAAVKVFKFPSWVTAAVAFNNTTSLPLLLVKSLEATGILDRLLIRDDTTSEAINRAQSYFLVCSIIGNCLTFAVGPRLIRSNQSEQAEDDKDSLSSQPREEDYETNDEPQDNSDERTSLIARTTKDVEDGILHQSRGRRSSMALINASASEALSFLSDFVNAPTIGACIGAIIGVIPPLHRAFFNDSFDGGIFTAWLTSSLQNIGQLFVSLQVIVVGVTLSSSVRKMRSGEESGHCPWKATLFVLAFRFVIWPLISIPIIWTLATKTKLLDDDPILWFAMMMMPTGPPAMKLIAMADVSGADEQGKMSVAKLLAIAYTLSPVLSLTVVGALNASKAAIPNLGLKS